MKRHVHGNDGHFQHFVSRRAGGQTLHLHAGPAENLRNLAFAVGQSLQHLIADTGHDGQQNNAAQETQRHIAALITDHREKNNGNNENNQQEAGAAAGMQR